MWVGCGQKISAVFGQCVVEIYLFIVKLTVVLYFTVKAFYSLYHRDVLVGAMCICARICALMSGIAMRKGNTNMFNKSNRDSS